MPREKSARRDKNESRDPAQDHVRNALKRMREIVRSGKNDVDKKFLELDLPFTIRRFRSFLAGHHIDPDNCENLQKIILHSLLAKVMLGTSEDKKRWIDILERLSGGGSYLPKPVNVEGRYFLYHGSYVASDRFSIHAIEIRLTDNSYEVIDSINDRIQAAGGLRVSHGYMTFFDRHTQFLLMPDELNETRVGFTFMLEQHPARVDKGELQQMVGIFITLTTTGQFAVRSWLLQRETNLDLEAMKRLSGAYRIDELRSGGMEQHLDAFGHLKNHMALGSPDPMLSWVSER